MPCACRRAWERRRAVLLGMPLDAWMLLVVSVGLGLALELAFYRARRRPDDGSVGTRSHADEAGPP